MNMNTKRMLAQVTKFDEQVHPLMVEDENGKRKVGGWIANGITERSLKLLCQRLKKS